MRKYKKMMCGHSQWFFTPIPQPGEGVWCLECDAPTSLPKTKRKQINTVANGRPRRLKSNPRSNNQYTKGRELNSG
jgi:hypothetical protein